MKPGIAMEDDVSRVAGRGGFPISVVSAKEIVHGIERSAQGPLDPCALHWFRELRRLLTPTEEALKRFLAEQEPVTDTQFDILISDLTQIDHASIVSNVCASLHVVVANEKQKGTFGQKDELTTVILEILRNFSRPSSHRARLSNNASLIDLLLDVAEDLDSFRRYRWLALGLLGNIVQNEEGVSDLFQNPRFLPVITMVSMCEGENTENRSWAASVLSNISNSAPGLVPMLVQQPMFVNTLMTLAIEAPSFACRKWGLLGFLGMAVTNENRLILLDKPGFTELIVRSLTMQSDVEDINFEIQEYTLELCWKLLHGGPHVHTRIIENHELVLGIVQTALAGSSTTVRIFGLENLELLAALPKNKRQLYANRELLFGLLDLIAPRNGHIVPSEVVTCAKSLLSKLFCEETRIRFFETMCALCAVWTVPRLGSKSTLRVLPLHLIPMLGIMILW